MSGHGPDGPPHDPPNGRLPRARGRALEGALLAVAVLAGAGFLYAIAGGQLEPAPSSSNGGPAPLACAASSSPAPSSLQIPASSPSGSHPAGSVLGVSYQVRALAASGAPAQVVVQMPSVLTLFPLAPAGTASVFVPATSLTVNTSAWAAGPSTTRSHPIDQTTTFDPAGGTVLSTQLIAVMASGPAGSVRLEVRWSWNLTDPTGSVENGGWTIPTDQGPFPSLFSPQPFAQLVATSGSPEPAGATFTVTLAADPAPSSYLLKLENATTGATLNTATFAPAGSASTFSGSIDLTGPSGGLAPGPYLVHVHGPCGGILYSVPVQVTPGTAPAAARP